jgi:ribosomal protein L40E
MDMKKISPSIFVLIVIFFLLPFVTISCQGQDVASLSGLNLVTGTKIETEKISPNPVAIIILLTAFFGVFLGLGIWKHKKITIISAITGAAGFLLTLILKFLIDNEVKSGPGFGTSYDAGFYLILMSFAGAAALNAYILNLEGDPIIKPKAFGATPGGGGAPARVPPIRSGTGGKICPHCNSSNPTMGKFCIKCGGSLVEERKESIGADGKVCPNCKTSNKSVSKFCVKCGSSLGDRPAEAGSMPQKPQPPVPPAKPPAAEKMAVSEQADKSKSIPAGDETIPFEDTGPEPVIKSGSAPVQAPGPAPIKEVKPALDKAPAEPEKAPGSVSEVGKPPLAENIPKKVPPAPLTGWRPLGIDIKPDSAVQESDKGSKQTSNSFDWKKVDEE